MRGESLRRPLHPVALLGLFLLLLTAYLYLQGWNDNVDSNTCRPVSMYPSYARIKSFDESHSRFASKYSLYLYREQGMDKVPPVVGQGFESLDGIPVLFIPGNAGSYRQVRLIAAESSILYFDENINVVANENRRNLDFFAADFNEDFTAFHGRTLLDQAEYLNEAVRFILLLYALTDNPPQSVLILAHSMGGIVARVMLTLPSYLPESINTIVTLASPHSAAPLTFDGDILKIYLAADRYWHDAFHDPSLIAYGRLDNVCVVSITGGLTDSILPADYTTLGFLVPPSNGLTVYTTGIPEVWTPMDHLAIVWCRQLRRSVLRALLEVVDFSSPNRVHLLKKRMAVFKQILLSGFEDTIRKDTANRRANHDIGHSFNIKFDVQDAVIRNGANEIWKSSDTRSENGPQFHVLPLAESSTVLILTDGPLVPIELVESLKQALHSAFLCKKSLDADSLLDFTSTNTKEFLDLSCVNTSPDLNKIPRSSKNVKGVEDSAFDGEAEPFWANYYQSQDLQGFDSLLIIQNQLEAENEHSGGFMIAQTSENGVSEHVVRGDMFSLMTRGAEVSLLANRPLAVNFNFPGAWSSILAYKVDLKESSGEMFEPFIRQWIEDPYETKWIIRLRGKSRFLVSMHGVAPYTPFIEHKPKNGLNLQLWSDPKGGWSDDDVAAVELTFSVDWINSLKLLVMRYRLAVVSHCLAISVLVAIFQVRKYHSTAKFPDYIYGLTRITSPEVLVPALVFLWLLTPVTKLRLVQQMLNMIDPVVLQDSNEINLSLQSDFKLNSFYLGLEENCLSFIGPLFYIMAIGINLVAYYIFTGFGYIVTIILAQSGRLKACVWKAQKESEKKSKSKSVAGKVAASALLLLAIPFFIPYQFAYVISFAIHSTTCIKLLHTKASRSCWNFNMSILMIMAWVLPINIPVLIVFVHNLNVSWATPFASHHNFLAVAPVLILVELCSYYSNVLPLGTDAIHKTKDKWTSKAADATLVYLALYSLIYGTRHTYWLHHLFNFWCCCVCLSVLNFTFGDGEEKAS